MVALLMVIKAIGLIMAVMGVAFVSVPQRLIELMPFFKVSRRIYIIGVLRLVIAVIFLLAASRCRWPVVIAVLGIITLISGVLVFALKLKHIRAFLDWWSSRTDIFLRLMGVLIVAVGLLIVFAV